MIKEVWKDIPGYEGLYQVSNLGRVKSLVRKGKKEEIILRQVCNRGYLQVRLAKNSISKTYKVHRLVAQAFIPNPHNYPMINHKDEDKTNNCVWNLEWCNNSYNQLYGTLPEKKRILNTNHPSKSVPVKQFTLEGKLIAKYPSQSEAARKTGIPQSCIYNNCAGKTKITHNYIFTY